MKKRLLALVLSTVLALTTIGCGSSETSATTGQSGAAASEGGYKETITIGKDGDPLTFDPVMISINQAIWIYTATEEGLVKVSNDGSAIEPCLAESWEISEDGTVYTFHLKEGTLFSDGNPVTTDDWIFTFERARDTEESAWTFAAELIEKMEAPDENTLVITLSSPSAAFLADLCMFNMGVQEKAYFDEVGEEGYLYGPVTTGAYKIAEYVPDQYTLLEKNEYWTNADSVQTKYVKFMVVTDSSSRIMQLKSGDLDLIESVPASNMAEIEGAGYTTEAVSSTYTKYLSLNNTKGALQDQKVRRAIRYAIDLDTLVAMVLYGYGEKADSYLTKYGMYYDNSYATDGYDVEAAKKLLAEAGYADGLELEVNISSGDAIAEQIATVLKDNLAQAGITLNIMSYDAATVRQMNNDLEHEMSLTQWCNDIIDPDQLSSYIWDPEVWHSFISGYTNDKTYQLYQESISETDDAARKEIYKELQEIYYEDVVSIPLYYSPFLIAYDSRLEGFVQTPLGSYDLSGIKMTE